MANTVIQLKNSGASGNTPTTLSPGELAINYADGKLYYGNQTNTAILFDVITEPTGLNQEIQFNDSGAFGASANLKFDKTTKTLITDNIVAGEITSNITTRISNVSNSAFAQANLAYNAANSAVTTGQANVGAGLIVVTGRTNLAYDKANAAYDYANTLITGGTSGDYFPTAPYGFVSQSMVALVSDDTFIQGELTGPVYDCSDNPVTPEGFYLEKDLGYLT
jgi:hypothetical protein